MNFKLWFLSSKFALTLGYLNPASNNPAQNYNLRNYVYKHHECWWRQQYKDCKSPKGQVNTGPWTHLSYNKNGEKTRQCRFTLGKQQVCTCITLFRTFYHYHYTATTQNFLNCFMFYIFLSVWMTQDKNFVFVSLNLVYMYSPWDFNERKACQHLANCTRWWLLKQCKFTS